MINEDAPTNSVGTGAETSLPPASEPPGVPRGWRVVKRWQKKKKKKKIYEAKTLYAFLVSLPSIGDTVVYASSVTDLKRRLRKYMRQVDDNVKVKRIFPSEVIDFFTDKRNKSIRRIQDVVKEEMEQDPAKEKQLAQQEAQKRIALAKKQAKQNLDLKRKELQKRASAGMTAPQQ